MKYYYDTEFIEGTQKRRIGKIELPKCFNTKNTIDLISIGIVAEDGREYYAVSKDFNLKEAWYRYDEEINRHFPLGSEYNKIYWIRENVLQPIYKEFLLMKKAESLYIHIGSSEYQQLKEMVGRGEIKIPYPRFSECFKDFKRLLKKYGKTNKQISQEIYDFVNPDLGFHVTAYNNSELKEGGRLDEHFKEHNVTSDGEYYYAQPEFYTYYGAYDHVALCWLFGKMIDLPNGFPMYSFDLKQEFDSMQITANEIRKAGINLKYNKDIKNHPDYPQQTNEHNALADARWNKELYEFLQKL